MVNWEGVGVRVSCVSRPSQLIREEHSSNYCAGSSHRFLNLPCGILLSKCPSFHARPLPLMELFHLLTREMKQARQEVNRSPLKMGAYLLLETIYCFYSTCYFHILTFKILKY